MNILIVDDMELVRNALKLLIKNYPGINSIFECSDGSEVIPFLTSTEEKIDLILMDVSMKNMDGLSATKLVKENYPEIPVIILTMHIEENYISMAKEVGASAFVSKNSSSQHIFEVIEKVLKGETSFNI